MYRRQIHTVQIKNSFQAESVFIFRTNLKDPGDILFIVLISRYEILSVNVYDKNYFQIKVPGPCYIRKFSSAFGNNDCIDTVREMKNILKKA